MSTQEERALAYLKGELSAADRAAFEEDLTRSADLRAHVERSSELLDLLASANEEATVRRVSDQIAEAIRRRASDIHIIPEHHDVVVWVRVDGRLVELARLPRQHLMPTVDRWKVMADMDLLERRLPQDGRVVAQSQGRDFDIRVNVMPTVWGERLTARILDKGQVLIGLDRLGLSEEHRRAIERLAELPNGLVLTSGGVGMGKTTVLYSMVAHMLRDGFPRLNILTVEDPVEYALNGISQTPVNRKAGLTFAAALRALLRCDPDVVMCGEIRDLESAEAIAALAVTGHLVLSLLHVPGAVLVPQRLREVGVPGFLVAQTIAGLIGQRLVRRVCSDCAVEVQPDPGELEQLGLSPNEGPFRRGAGCESCRQTGYRGRTGLFEVIEVDRHLRGMIAREEPAEALWEAAFGEKGGSLLHDGRAKVLQGITTTTEVARVLFDYPMEAAHVR